MKTCPFCGSSTKEEDVFCNQCGKFLVKTCPNCGEQIEINAAFCRECGFELNKPEAGQEEIPVEKTLVPVYKKWWFWVVTAAAILGLVLLFSSGGSRGNSGSAEEPEQSVSTSAIAKESDDKASEPTQDTIAEATDSQLPEAPENVIIDDAKAQEIADFQETVDKAMEDAFPKDSESNDSGKKESMDIKTFQKTMDDVLEDAFGKGCFETDLDQEKKLYNVYVWMDGGKEALKTAQDGDEEDLAYWNARIGLLLETSKKIKEKLDSSGLSDWSVTLSLLDEDAHSDIYAITKDGFIYYEIIKDGELET